MCVCACACACTRLYVCVCVWAACVCNAYMCTVRVCMGVRLCAHTYYIQEVKFLLK